MSFESNDQFNNPILGQENYAAQYQANIEALKNQPHVIELDKLCYEIFEMTDAGKRLLEIIKERWLIPALADKRSPTYTTELIWAEGFKEFGRFILTCLIAHKQRITAGK